MNRERERWNLADVDWVGVRAAIAFLGDEGAADVYGREVVDHALATRPGSREAALCPSCCSRYLVGRRCATCGRAGGGA